MNHLNYSFNTFSRKNVIHNVSPKTKQVTMPDGSISVVEVEKLESPYEGMSANSFTLDSQLQAGVRLQPSPRNTDVSVYKVDKVTAEVQRVIDANKNGIKLNNKSKK